MNSTVSDIQEHFRIKTDGELLSLACDARTMTPDSRLALLAELQRRFSTIRKGAASIQLVHGWYTVLVQRCDIRFPDVCPNCLRKPADVNVSVTSQATMKYRVIYTKHESVTLKVPYCLECAKKLKYRRRLVAWPSYLVIAAWIGVCVWFNLGKLAVFIGGVLLSIPLVSVLREASAVTLGGFDKDWLEFRFRLADYAERFASVNDVLAQNAETIKDDFLAALESIRTAGAVEPISGDFHLPKD
jgi:hypothetical protein